MFQLWAWEFLEKRGGFGGGRDARVRQNEEGSRTQPGVPAGQGQVRQEAKEERGAEREQGGRMVCLGSSGQGLACPSLEPPQDTVGADVGSGTAEPLPPAP